ncbi:1-deoxy-D-xylulose-5-phosphate synthase [Ilyobacter polytropus]|uniref:1-deoxy-D-xylulose-5-phosphate synthase n=1 Tax=Ilyobacter polytropus (strain ATCC 51220 / DSM 2926 / LMG 16218 / CuHBu1) TaxID=572544 RepID=E3HA82_ILYPC|nr:1-deoxy-D-xylulose-5-phosphate synthase [Ilyobacter polytropus]ADO83487.1 1-deoxy-D-xylulose-5-phosphate synthase [Ilyobacter polytropus DSM 2926]
MNIKEMNINQIEKLAQEIRTQLIDVVSKNGGHLAPNLGVVELTLALHKVFDSPKDKILFDVGHQSYVHKIVTGRDKEFSTLRTRGGVGPFLNPEESEHDAFISGHAGSGLSAASGIAAANPDSKVIVVVGDASIANGTSLEALNDIGGRFRNLIILLNDNEMSIGENVGSLSRFFSKLLVSKTYMNLKDEVRTLVRKAKIGKRVGGVLKRAEHSVKQFFAPMSICEDLGFKFLGVIDGHDSNELIETFEKAKIMEGPILIHVKTQKGKGYSFAEKNQEKFHGISPFDVQTGNVRKGSSSYSQIFGEKICQMGEKDKDIYAISAAMVKGTGLVNFFEKFPERSHNVGIAEGHAVTFAGGLAISGKKPYVAIYSTFLQRAYSQLIHDISLQNLPVRFIVDRAGIVGEDGKTHQGVYDISYFLSIEGFTVIAPTTCRELEEALEISRNHTNGPMAIRIPRSTCYDIDGDKPLEFGKWKEMEKGKKNLYIATGSMLNELMVVKDELCKRGIGGTIVSAAFISPLDENYLVDNVKNYDNIFVLEEAYDKNSFGTSILEFLNDRGLYKKVYKISLESAKIPHGKRDDLLFENGLRGSKLVDRIEGCINANK